MTTGEGLTGSVVKSQDIDVTVLGEFELLKKVGAPSIIFLPGVLFLLCWQFLWSIDKKQDQRQAYPLTMTSGGFWVIAVAISLVFAFAYPQISLNILKERRDYLAGYGLRDFLYLFGAAIILACVLYVCWLLLKWLAAQVRAFIAWLKTPSVDDQPIDILRKLGWLGEGIVSRLAHPTGNADQRVRILGPWSNSALLWIAPPAQLTENDTAPADELNFIQSVRAGQVSDAWKLYRRIKKGLKKGWWTFRWQTVGAVARPRKVSATDWPEVAGAEGVLIVFA